MDSRNADQYWLVGRGHILLIEILLEIFLIGGKVFQSVQKMKDSAIVICIILTK